MSAENVDIVFVIDASDSMKPYIDGLRLNLQHLIAPLEQSGYNWRLGLVTHNVIVGLLRVGYNVYFSGYGEKSRYSWKEQLNKLYSGADNSFFLSDINKFKMYLNDITLQGDENSFLGIDLATDFPFRSIKNTRRVIAFFSDEEIEKGGGENLNAKFANKLIDKIMARKILLFGYIPQSKLATLLGEAERSEITYIKPSDLAHLDFKKLLSGMGKSISASTLQSNEQEEYEQALFGEKKWVNVNLFGGKLSDS